MAGTPDEMMPFSQSPTAVPPCRLGYEEHDGTRYCFEHYGFAATFIGKFTCDRKPRRS